LSRWRWGAAGGEQGEEGVGGGADYGYIGRMGVDDKEQVAAAERRGGGAVTDMHCASAAAVVDGVDDDVLGVEIGT